MTAEQKLAKLSRVFDTCRRNADGSQTSTNAYYNLMGAIIDIERAGKCDKVSLRTLKRVERQLGEIGNVLGL